MNSEIIVSLFEAIPMYVMLAPILVCSIVAVAVVIERLVFFHKISFDYRMLVTKVVMFLREGSKKNALKECKSYSGPIIDILSHYLESSGSTNKDLLLEQSSEKTIKLIEKYIGIISTIATIAPMLGLLGTVTGMLKSFTKLAAKGPVAHDLLAQGIAEALITTALGLLVAIPSLIFYNYMVAKAEYYIKEVEFIANSLLDTEHDETI